jgi:hypothetical protein
MSRQSCQASLHRPLYYAATALILTAVAGCGSGSTYPVRGKVIFKDGTPLAGGQILFRPINGKPPLSARSDIQPDGSFALGTYKEGDGAMAGEYQAAINPPLPPKLRRKGANKPILDPRFEKYETSGLEFEVKPGRNRFTIEVTRP